VTHPTLGAPPRDLRRGHPLAAQALRDDRERLAVRTLEIAIDGDPTIRTRHDELGLRHLLHDAEVLLDRLATSVAAGDPTMLGGWAEQVVPLYRRRRVPLDDLIALADGARSAVGAVVAPDEAFVVDAAIDEAIRVLRWNRRLAGDARRRNPLLAFLYKGA
jgi:hypothetical protein